MKKQRSRWQNKNWREGRNVFISIHIKKYWNNRQEANRKKGGNRIEWEERRVGGEKCESQTLRLWFFFTLYYSFYWGRKWPPTPVFLLGESHGQRSLAGYSLWGPRVGHDWATFFFPTWLTFHQITPRLWLYVYHNCGLISIQCLS